MPQARAQLLQAVQDQLGYAFHDPDILALALTHRSIQPPEPPDLREMPPPTEEPPLPWHNERLEFLGDAVISLLVSRQLYARFPHATEGEMSHWRSALVNTRSLSSLAKKLGLGQAVHLGRGEAMSGGRYKASILAGVMEAVFGAVLLDGGHDAAEQLARRLFVEKLARIKPGRLGKDFKSLLQERLQSQGMALPAYEVIHLSGAPHERTFIIECQVEGLPCGRGEGRSKRKAEQAAAQTVLDSLESLPGPPAPSEVPPA